MFRLEDAFWWYRALHARTLAAARRCIADRPAPRILDAGCGTGAMAARLRDLGEVSAVDLSPVALGFAARRRAAAGPRLACASVESLPFVASTFDLVVSLDVLCHGAVADEAAAMAEMARVLRPGGHLLLNLPAYPGLLSAHDRAVHNTRRYRRATVAGQLAGAGLEVVRLGYWNSLLFVPAAVVRLARRGPRRGKPGDAAAALPETPDLSLPAPWLNRLLGGVVGFERRLERVLPLPFGLSLFAVGRKRE